MYISPIPTSATPTKSPLLTPIAEYEFVDLGRGKLNDKDIIASQDKYTTLYCLLCPDGRKFTTKAGLALHHKTHVRKFLKKQRSERIRKPKVFSCKECDEKFTTRKLLNEHTDQSHKNQIFCDCCGTYFKDRFDFEWRHAISDGLDLAEVHDNMPRTRSQSRTGARSISLQNMGAYYSYGYDSEFENLNNGITRPSTSLSMSRYLPRKRKKHIDSWIDDFVSDDDGCYDTVSVRSLSRASSKYSRSHNRITDGSVSPPNMYSAGNFSPDDYICSEESCYDFFPSLNDVTIHEMRVHKRLALFRCTECRLRFTTSTNLVQHKEQQHPLDTIECLLCDMKISGITAINDHVNLHKGYSAKCEVCSKVFLSKYYLDEHLKDKSKHKSYKESKASILVRITYVSKNSK